MRQYIYDSDGRMMGEYGVAATDVKAETIWLSPEVDSSGQLWGGDDGAGGYAPLAIATGTGGATLYWVHGNHLGVPIVTTDTAGNLAAPTGFTRVGFPGQTQTLVDLYYNEYRDYDPTTGSYIQADPIGLDGGSNPYAYAGNNPIRFTDPQGLQPTTWDVVKFGARWWLKRQARPARATPWGRAYGIGEAIGAAAAVAKFCYDNSGDNSDRCEKKREEDEFECNQWNIYTNHEGYSRREGYSICLSTAATRYGECRSRGMNPNNITTPLFLPTRRRGIPDPSRRR
ncbi:MAG: RHS repeat-associated core domain-containing protein [Sphingomonas bacterium]